MVVVVDKDAYEAKDDSELSVEQALTETVEGGKIGVLNVDPKSLDLRAPGKYCKYSKYCLKLKKIIISVIP